jgi:hypothetical protein
MQKAVHKLDQIITEFCLTVSVEKTEWVAIKGRDAVRTKIVIDNNIREEVIIINIIIIMFEKGC